MGATKDLRYERLNELIFDEEQIVTSLSVADELKISKYDAQCLLSEYANDTRKQSKEFHVTYLLCGALKDGKGVALHLAKEDDLKDKKCLFDSITAEVIYSIQKGQLIDFNAIASVNSKHENGIGFLVSKNCIKRNIKSKPLPAVTTVKHNVDVKNSEPSSSTKSEKSVQENGKGHTQSSQKLPKSKQNGGIASFFAKVPVKSQSVNNSVNNGNNGVSKEEARVSKEEVNGHSKQAPNKDQNVCKVVSSDEKIETDKVVHKEENLKKSKQTDGHVSKKRKKENKNNGPNKKRKRIQEVCDSDSSDMFGDEENEDIIEMSDEEPVQVPVATPVPETKNKKRKAIDKTYVDEEGFIVTKTEYIFESASEDEEKSSSKFKPEVKIMPQKKNEKLNTETKLPGNKGKSNKKQPSAKQPTLMSFFKKS